MLEGCHLHEVLGRRVRRDAAEVDVARRSRRHRLREHRADGLRLTCFLFFGGGGGLGFVTSSRFGSIGGLVTCFVLFCFVFFRERERAVDGSERMG